MHAAHQMQQIFSTSQSVNYCGAAIGKRNSLTLAVK